MKYLEKPQNRRVLRLQESARRFLTDKKATRYVWEHTSSPEAYDRFMDALRLISKFQFVDWTKEAEVQ